MPKDTINDNSITKDDQSDVTLRPQTLHEYFFQGSIKNNLYAALNIFLQAAKERGDALDHLLFHGPPGLGKTTLSFIIANEMNTNIKVTSGPAIERVGDLASILTNLTDGDILFIDEIHRLNKAVEETMYPAMEDYCLDIVLGKGPSAQTVRLELPQFTIIGATTRISLMSAPLRDRFGVNHRLDFFDHQDLTKVVERSSRLLNISITQDGCMEIAKRSRGTPRIANRLIKRIRDFSQVKKIEPITPDLVHDALEMLHVDHKGLNKSDQNYLEIIITKFNGGPVGLTTLSSALSEDQGTIEDVIEPYLIQQGFIKKTSRGRVSTKKAFEHMGVEKPNTLL